MKVAEFQAAVIIAKADVTIDPVKHSIDEFYGCGIKGFEPIVVTLEQVAMMVRWQAACLDGSWDENEIENCKCIAKRKFILKNN